MSDVERIFDRPEHPYTQALLASSPVTDPDEQAQRREERLRRAAA